MRIFGQHTYGEIAQDAFGHIPIFEDKGNMRRAVLALGRQDVDVSAIKPRIEVNVLGASSDHLILDVKGQSLKVGAEVRFDVGYSALLRAMMSPYVEKVYLPRLPCVDYLLACAARPSVRLRRQARRGELMALGGCSGRRRACEGRKASLRVAMVSSASLTGRV
jgi:hypothetical protein